MDLGLKDKVYLVAGASKGLGFGIADALAREGAWVSIGSRSQANIEQAVAQLQKKTHAHVAGFVFDARDEPSIHSWVQASKQQFGQIHGIVVNAGGPPAGFFDDLNDQAWQAAFELTVLSAVRMIRAVLPFLRTHKEGSILILTSIAVKEPIGFLLLSNVMRSGVSSLAKSLSQYLAKDSIRVNQLVPGLINTDRLRLLDQTMADKKNWSVAEQTQSMHATIPLGRYGEVDEFSRAACFLLSNAASYITGATLVVDGGKLRSAF